MRFRAAVAVLLIAAVVLCGVLGAAGPARAATVPTLPIDLDSHFVGNLTAPGLVAGASGSIGLTLTNPLPASITSVHLSLEVYAFNAFPGNATSTLAAPPVLTTATTSSSWANFTVGSMPSGLRTLLSVGVVTASATPVGAYSVRSALSFTAANGTSYRLASRGWFTQALWEQATEEPNGSAVLDNQSLHILNTSGVLPETSIQVTSSALQVALYVILGVVFVLAGIGAYLYFRRSGRSSGGAR